MARGDYRAAAIDAQKLLQKEPNNVALRLRYADALLPIRNYAEAATQLRRAQSLGAPAAEVTPRLLEALVSQGDFPAAVAITPDTSLLQQPKVMRLRAEALLGVGRTAEASQLLTQAVAANPRDARSHLDLATVQSRAGQQAEVKAELGKALELGAEDQLVQAAVGGWEARNGDLPAAKLHLAKAAALARAAKDRAAESTALINLSDVALALGDVAGAQECVKRMEQLLPGSEPTVVLQARLALRNGRPAEAEPLLDKLLAKNPRSAAGNFLLGAIKAQQGYLAQAQQYLSVALSASPNDQIRRLLADVELRQGKANEVLTLVGAAASSRDSELLSLGGRASLSTGDPGKAIEYFERSHDLAASSTPHSLDLAEAYIAANRATDAVSLLRKTDVTGQLVYRREALLTAALAQTGDKAAALAEARGFAKDHPNDAPALVAAGRGLWAAGDPAAAHEAFTRATQVQPKEISAWNALGVLALSQGNSDEATRSFDEALRLQPASVDAFIGKAQVALKAGKRDEVVKQLEAAHRAQPTALAPLLALARVYLAANDGQRLSEVFAEAQRLAPQNMQVRTLEAEKAFAQRQIPEAVALYHALTTDFPAVAAFQAGLAQAYLVSGRLSEAREANLQALKLDPGYWRGDVFEASVALQENQLQAAAEAIAHLSARPGVSKAVVAQLQGDLEMRKSQFAAAAQDYAAAYAATPSAEIVLREYAALRSAHSAFRQKPLRDWLERSPDDAGVRLALAQDLQSSGDANGASQEYLALLQHNPGNVAALNNLAWLKVQAGAIAEGLAFAKQAYERDSRSPAVADTYGWALLQSNNVPQALPILRAARSAAPQDPAIRYHLAVALVRSDLQPEAQQELEAIVGSHFPEQDAARTLLKSLTTPRS